jgi:hypothetical protein
MKRLIIVVILSAVISLMLTFVFWPPSPVTDDPIREQYADVFTRFGMHADAAYRQFDGAVGLELLSRYEGEGLRLILHCHDLIAQLQPHLDADALMAVCRADADRLTEFLRFFQPGVVAELYQQFELTGLRLALEDPERVFLLRRHGRTLVELARLKGPIVFDLVRVYTPEFLELYYDDALFTAIQTFGIEGLLAIRQFRGMAETLLTHFGHDPDFARAVQTYGYQQVIPVLYHLYQSQEAASLPMYAQDAEPPQAQHARVQWGLDQLIRQGPTFLRQFAIAPDGTVARLPVMALTNVLEELLLGDARAFAPAPPRSRESECEQIYAALALLDLLPGGRSPLAFTRCAYVRDGLPGATSRDVIAGLAALDLDDALVEAYGPMVAVFAGQYGAAGLELLRQSDGLILTLAQLYGPDVVEAALLYGPDVLAAVDEFGREALEAIRVTQGAIAPYIMPHGEQVLRVLRYPDGPTLIGLASIFGEDIFRATLRYPDDFPRLLFKYGHAALAAFTRYDAALIDTLRRYGDDGAWYAGQYGDAAFRLLNMGAVGVTLLRVLPEAKLRDAAFLRQPFPLLLGRLLLTSPRVLHEYAGRLGSHYIRVDARYAQAFFWFIISVCVCSVVGWLYDLFRRVFWVG